MLRRKAIAAAAICAVLGPIPQAARADSDPASDFLPTANVFFPFTPSFPPKLKAQLNGATAAAKKAGYPLKVAIIASAADLGGVPNLFNQPTQYAAYLGREISFNAKKQPLLVVMPVGLGTFEAGPKATSAIAGVKVSGSDANGLGNAALEGVVKLAAASGHPIKGFKPASSGGGGGASPVVFAIPIALLVLVLAVVSYRRAGGDEEDDEEDEPAAA